MTEPAVQVTGLNGAGKSPAVKVPCTLADPAPGSARVAACPANCHRVCFPGVDSVRRAGDVCASHGYFPGMPRSRGRGRVLVRHHCGLSRCGAGAGRFHCVRRRNRRVAITLQGAALQLQPLTRVNKTRHRKGRRRVATGASHPASLSSAFRRGPGTLVVVPRRGPGHRYESYTADPPYVQVLKTNPNLRQLFPSPAAPKAGADPGQRRRSDRQFFKFAHSLHPTENFLCPSPATLLRLWTKRKKSATGR
jgi:hypothetical protein